MERKWEHKAKMRDHKGSRKVAGKKKSLSSEDRRVRLQRFLSECGVASRRAAEKLIEEGKVKVNGVTVVEMGTKVDPANDQVMVGKKIVRPVEKGVLLFHKPTGVMSTMSDPEGRPCIADFLTSRYRSYFPVGRLDWDSSGLMILTNDGDLADRLSHPRYEMERVYEVRVEGEVSDRTLEKLLKGITLSDGPARLSSVAVQEVSDTATWLEVSIREGRNRIIRRMMEYVRHPVIKLRRISHGPLRLGSLSGGQLRKLTEKEYERLRRAVL